MLRDMQGALSIPTLALVLSLVVPIVAQRPAENWIGVARRIGGPGAAHEDRYVRLVPSRGWMGATSPMWLEFGRGAGTGVLRGTIPVLAGRAPSAVAVLREELPGTADILVSDTFGAGSEHVHLRFIAEGAPARIAGALRRACERIEPGALARIDTTGVIQKDSFECEDGFVICTESGERVDVGELPVSLAREGMRVRLRARRRNARHGTFLYYGAPGNWRTVATLVHVEACPSPRETSDANRRDESEWYAACRRHARALIDGDRYESARLDTPLARGFDRLEDPGFVVCPRCRRPLAKDWLFADTAHDRVDASLRCCARDGLYFLGRDGFDHGPYFPDPDARKDER